MSTGSDGTGTSELRRTDDLNRPGRPSPQPAVKRQETTSHQAGKSDVLGVVGLGPSEFTGDEPRLSPKAARAPLVDRRGQHPDERLLGQILGDVPTPAQLMESRCHLGPPQSRRDQVIADGRESILRQASLYTEAGVDDQ